MPRLFPRPINQNEKREEESIAVLNFIFNADSQMDIE